jgi:transcriptional regulator with XRE-family HTH domain
MSKALRPEVILKRVLESYPGSTSIVASEKVAERLSITGRTIRSYTKAERRPSERFCEAFAKAYGPFEQDEWVDRDELAKPYVPDKMPELTPAEKETRRLQMLVNRFCDWCVGGDDAYGRTPRCPDATCILRSASPLPLATNAKSKPVASADRWD